MAAALRGPARAPRQRARRGIYREVSAKEISDLRFGPAAHAPPSMCPPPREKSTVKMPTRTQNAEMFNVKNAEITVEMPKPTKPRGPPSMNPFFASISDVMLSAKRRRLEPEDLLSLHASDDVGKQVELLCASWENAVKDWEAKKAAAKPTDKKPPPAMPSLLGAVWPQVKGLWCLSFALFLVSIGLSFIGPLMLTWTVRLIESTQICGIAVSAKLVETDPEYALTLDPLAPPPISEECRRANNIERGFIYAAVMFAAKLLEAICRSWHDHIMMRTALRARSGVIGLIYRKCLWLSGMGGEDATLGKIQNLMANDAQFFVQIAPLLNQGLVAPVQVQ